MTITPVNTAHYEMVLPLDYVFDVDKQAICTALLVAGLAAQCILLVSFLSSYNPINCQDRIFTGVGWLFGVTCLHDISVQMSVYACRSSLSHVEQ